MKIVLNSSLSGEGYLLKVGSFSVGSPVIVSTVSNPIFDTKSTEDKTKISTPMLSGSGKNILFFGYLAEISLTKISGGGFSE